MSESDRESDQTLHASSRGPNTTGLYTLLRVERNATPSELKRAYRRLALVHHPDRNISNRAARESSDTNGSSSGGGETFVRIQYAYDVLSDARKRRIYDRYGEMGVQMAGRVGGALLDPQVTSVLSSFAVGSAMVALLMVVFFALLARRVDHFSGIPFSLVFAPLWLIDLIVVLGIAWFHAKGHELFDEHGDAQPDRERADDYDGDADSVADSDSDDLEDRNSAPHETHPYVAGYGATATTTETFPPIDGTPSNSGFQQTGDSGADAPLSADPSPSAACRPATSKTSLLTSQPDVTTNSRGSNNRDSAGRARSSARKYKSRMKRRRLRQVRFGVEALFRRVAAPAPVIYLTLLFVFQIFVALRLDHHVSWSVWHIVSPWLGIEAVHFILLSLHLVQSVCLAAEQKARAQAAAASDSNDHPSPEDSTSPLVLSLRSIVVMAADTYWWLAIRVSLALLIASKLDPLGMAHSWSWALVFGPSYLPFVRWTIMLCFLRQRLRSMGRGEAEIAQNAKAIFGAYVAVVVLTCAFLYSFVALLVWKLSLPQALRMALVLVPAFIVLSLCCCFCSCISLCLSYGISATLDEEQRMEAGDAAVDSAAAAAADADDRLSAGSPGGNGRLVPANRRIE
ncbi:hypothetical protein IW140_006244 [Coemansia sp. RSA 1813]|nr:hypothetical protein EV178_006231 [Coemansia sp. RSA 1646]KAJ1764944.1 hypothetical protein LPJ74_006531 [Coemansia sp. RSA 1843]KAJ2085730.1 hypothetical protein IW138_006153 [Coemansia sp. RSA 986]KAJ2210498.1 hypothetical protein EV179_006203 [Coemansia sp. RSA 487]KAJ2563063.1 hypothetical protein IW140_006244 [Coemansia sp. RSA 1813]